MTTTMMIDYLLLQLAATLVLYRSCTHLDDMYRQACFAHLQPGFLPRHGDMVMVVVHGTGDAARVISVQPCDSTQG